jgi:prepilin-type N-terminal cleavage/methylation domain-containing protein
VGGSLLKFNQFIANKTGNTPGFSLVELLMAMMIFSTCLLLIIGMFPAANKASAQARHIVMSTEIARKNMEILKSLGWQSLDMNSQVVKNISNNPVSVKTVINGVSSDTTYSVIPMISTFEKDPDTGEPTIKLVRVQVKYSHGNVFKSGATLETLVSKKALEDI